jgi:hypothetical protein
MVLVDWVTVKLNTTQYWTCSSSSLSTISARSASSTKM